MSRQLLILVILGSIYHGCFQKTTSRFTYHHGAIVRGDTTSQSLALVFTGHEFGEGGEHILNTLGEQDVKASFFLTGDFYGNPEFTGLIQGLRQKGHYLGAHSDKHLLYCDWVKRDSLLVSRSEFVKDIMDNYTRMESFGIQKSDAPLFLPPYEWYNDSISNWDSRRRPPID